MSRFAVSGWFPSSFRFDSLFLCAAVLLACCGDGNFVSAQTPADNAPQSPAAEADGAAEGKAASVNPAMCAGPATPDGKLGAFRQSRTSDCFFLSTLIALSQDANGRGLLESVFHKGTEPDAIEVVFPNQTDERVVVKQEELKSYRLTDVSGKKPTTPSTGDPDVRMLEIAGDKLWKKQEVKPEGLWDDVPMNAFFMFTAANQRLIWNRAKASDIAIKDIDKYKRLPQGIVDEIQVTSTDQAEEALKAFVNSDTDGLSIVWCNYVLYHALTILEIDFAKREFKYLDPGRTDKLQTENLDQLLEGLVDGRFAINYLEVPG